MAEFVKRSFSAGEIAPNLYARADLNKYQNALAVCKDWQVLVEGGIQTRAGTKFVAPFRDNAADFRLIPFKFSVSDTYALAFTDDKMRVIRNGGLVLEDSFAITNITQGNPANVTAPGHNFVDGDEVYIGNPGGMNELHNWFFKIDNVSGDNFQLVGENTTVFDAYTGGGTVARVYEIDSPYAAADLDRLQKVQSLNVMTFCHKGYDPYELSRTGHTSWTFTLVDYATQIAAPTGLAVVSGGDGESTYDRTYKYVVTAVDSEGNESLASASASVTMRALEETRYAALSWNAVVGAVHYNVYKAHSDVSDVFGYLGRSKTLTYRDYNLAPDLTDTPLQDFQPFNGAGNKPGTMGYYQQRLVFASTLNRPGTVYTTQSGHYHSLRKSEPTRDSDAITLTPAVNQMNEIRHVVPLKKCLLLGDGAEILIVENQDNVLVPESTIEVQSEYGVSYVEPIVVGDTALFLTARGSRLRDVRYTFESDSYDGNDLSVFSQHLFRGRQFVDMAVATEPYSIVWLVRDDGILLGCTYNNEHEVVAWHQHDVGGVVKSICTVTEGTHEALYLGVERVVNGETVRYIERLHNRDWEVAEDAFCVDCGLSYEGAAATSFSGARHLAGETLVGLADGNVVRDITVSEFGKFEAPNAAQKLHVGFSFAPEIETLEIDAAQLTVKGQSKHVSEVAFKFFESRGGKIGIRGKPFYEVKSREAADGYDDIALRSYEIELAVTNHWSEGGQFMFRQDDPLPVTILAMQPSMAVG